MREILVKNQYRLSSCLGVDARNNTAPIWRKEASTSESTAEENDTNGKGRATNNYPKTK